MQGSCVIGVDPDTKGLIVVLDTKGKYVDDIKLEQSPRELFDFLSVYALTCSSAVLERVGPRPRQCVKRMWKFAEVVGKIKSILDLTLKNVQVIVPTMWRTRVGLRLGDGKKEQMVLARRLFPDQNIDRESCSAFLIATFAKQLIK